MKHEIDIIDTFIKEGYSASSIEASGGPTKVIITLLRKENITIAIAMDKYGGMWYTAEENRIPVSFHKNFLEIEKWKGDSYEIKKEKTFQPSQSAALTLLSDVAHYSQINVLDFIIVLSQK